MAKHLRCTFCGLARHGTGDGLQGCARRFTELGHAIAPELSRAWWDDRPDEAAYPYREPHPAPTETHYILGTHPDNLSQTDTPDAPKLAQFRPSHARPIRW